MKMCAVPPGYKPIHFRSIYEDAKGGLYMKSRGGTYKKTEETNKRTKGRYKNNMC